MVLDEDALEAMLRRGNDREQGTLETVTTDQTEEYEVYERKQDPEAETPGNDPTAAAPDPTPEEGPAATEYEEFRPSRQDPAPIPGNDSRHAPQAPTLHDERGGSEASTAAMEGPASAREPPAPEPPAPEPPEPEPAAPQEGPPAFRPQAPAETRRRPHVWPPVSSRHETGEASAASGTAESPGSTDPSQPAARPTAHEERTHGPTGHAAPAPAASGDGCRIAVVQALFNQELTDMMADLAVSHARKRGAEIAHHVTVPGVFDLPLMTKRMAESDDVDAVVVIGCVVQGETSHDELITHATAKTLQEVALATGKPIGFGVTGPGMTWEQAEARVVSGKHAVEAALGQWTALAQG